MVVEFHVLNCLKHESHFTFLETLSGDIFQGFEKAIKNECAWLRIVFKARFKNFNNVIQKYPYRLCNIFL